MPKYMKISDIRTMPYSELERWWEVDFDVLVTTAIAEATGHVHATVAAALQSDTWVERWADALYAGAGELASSAERMMFTRDDRLARVKRQSGSVQLRMGQANTLLRQRQREQGWDMLGEHLKDARLIVLSILAKHYPEQVEQLLAEELVRHGLAAQPPLYGLGHRDVLEAVEDAARRGLIETPDSAEVQDLLAVPPHELTQVVARDVKDQQERCVTLRHPLLLRGWAGALEHLRDRHCELAGIPAQFTVALAALDMRELRAMDEEEAWSIINRRRFIRALAQRWRECQMHIRQLGRTVAQRSEELRLPWYEARHAAREELGRRHPDQMTALLGAFTDFCEPGTTRLRRDALTARARGHLVRELKEALSSGQWRALLDTGDDTRSEPAKLTAGGGGDS